MVRFNRNPRIYMIEGMEWTLAGLIGVARNAGSNITMQGIMSRINSGVDTVDKLTAPPKECTKASRDSRKKKAADARFEMQGILERLGPPKRY